MPCRKSAVEHLNGVVVNTTTSKHWEERMMSHLESLAAKMVQSRDFGYLSTVADLLVGPEWSGMESPRRRGQDAILGADAD